MLTWEFSVLDFIQTRLRSGIGDVVMPLVTHLGDNGAIGIILALARLIYPKTRRTGAVLAATLALEVLCCKFDLEPSRAPLGPGNFSLPRFPPGAKELRST